MVGGGWAVCGGGRFGCVHLPPGPPGLGPRASRGKCVDCVGCAVGGWAVCGGGRLGCVWWGRLGFVWLGAVRLCVVGSGWAVCGRGAVGLCVVGGGWAVCGGKRLGCVWWAQFMLQFAMMACAYFRFLAIWVQNAPKTRLPPDAPRPPPRAPGRKCFTGLGFLIFVKWEIHTYLL